MKVDTVLSWRFSKGRLPSCGAYRPRLVAHVVNGREGVDARDPPVLQADDEVPEILVLGHAEGVLADQHKVWFERPGGGNRAR